MARFIEYEDDRPRAQAPVLARVQLPKRAPSRPTRRAGKQVRTVIATGKAACGGHSLLVAFGAEDFADFVGMTSEVPGRAAAAFRKAARRGLVDPTSLESLVAFRDRRGDGRARCQVFAGGRQVATATLRAMLPTSKGVTAAVSRITAVDGRKWEGREVQVVVPFGPQKVTFTGKLTRTTFEGT